MLDFWQDIGGTWYTKQLHPATPLPRPCRSRACRTHGEAVRVAKPVPSRVAGSLLRALRDWAVPGAGVGTLRATHARPSAYRADYAHDMRMMPARSKPRAIPAWHRYCMALVLVSHVSRPPADSFAVVGFADRWGARTARVHEAIGWHGPWMVTRNGNKNVRM